MPGDDGRSGPRPDRVAPEAETLLAGVAVRPFAQSAARAGADALAVDHFGDRDHRSDLPVLSLRRDAGAGAYSARRLVELAGRVRAREVAYAADLENHPALVARLARPAGRRLLGNPPEVLRRARDPFAVAAALRGAGLPTPEARPADDPPRRDGGGRWLRKPLRGGGGRGVRAWRPDEPVGGDAYLQERVDGVPVALLFLADGRRARLLAVTRMLVGREAFGARGHLYCGSLLRLGPGGAPLPPPGSASAAVAGAARRVAETLAGDLGLRGLNGVDAILRDGELWPVEVNPRWTSSMELLEVGARAGGPSLPRTLFALHRAACGGDLPPAGALPGGGPAESRPLAREVRGKAVLRARRDGRAPDLEGIDGLSIASDARRDPSSAGGGIALADVPEPGDPLPGGGPVCTLLASAPDAGACRDRLERGAARVYRELGEEG